MLTDALLFLLGSLAHLGVAVPLGVATWREPFVLPAAIVEGIGAVFLLGAILVFVSGWGSSMIITQVALWYCFLGVLWGMVFLALGTNPPARTVTNDFLHIGMLLVTTIALVWSK